MKLTIKAKLLTIPEQHQSLKKTMEVFNNACDYISQRAFEVKTFNQVKLHHLIYYEARKQFPELSSQFIVRAIAKVSDSYLAEKRRLHRFKKYSAVIYDQRLLSFKRLSIASINSIGGRLKIPFIIGRYKSLEDKSIKGQADLTFENNKFFLNIVIEFPDGTPFDPKGFLGIDKGIVNIAVDSDGNVFSGRQVDSVRKRLAKIKSSLQKRGSKSAKRHLKKISKKQSKFQKDTNHCISKKIVSTAKGTERAIVLEDLTGIRTRQKVRRADRQRFSNWAFYQLDSFIDYKAKLAGVPVLYVNPRNTSRTCSVCGSVSKSNRKSQSIFSCKSCGITLNADFNGAVNIASKGNPINLPIAVHAPRAISPSLGTASHLL
jgi:IS605 OrfB family transposase